MLKRVVMAFVFVGAFSLMLWQANITVEASSIGVSGWSGADGSDCSTCHTGGEGTSVPQVTVSGDSTVEPSDTVTFMLAITSTNPLSQTIAGWNVKIADGTLQNAGTISGFDSDAGILEVGEFTHKMPAINDENGVVNVAFDWTAPVEAGTYTVFAAVNSANNDNSNGAGDAGATTTFQITVEDTVAVGLDSHSAETHLTLPRLLILVMVIATGSLLRKQSRRFIA